MKARNKLIQEILIDLGNTTSEKEQALLCQEIVCLECLNEDCKENLL